MAGLKFIKIGCCPGIIFLFLFLFFQSRANNPVSNYWVKANSCYQLKQYDSAVYYYEQLAAMHPENAEVYYNLGNAYYKLNRIGSSVLNFERALKFNPGFRNARENLALTQSRIANRIPRSEDIFFVRWWKSLTQVSLAQVWALTSLFLFLLMLGMYMLIKFNIAPSWLSLRILPLFIVIWIGSLTFAYVAANRKKDSGQGVVMNSSAVFRVDDKKTLNQIFIPEGTVVKLEARKGNWIQVTLPDGRIGWMELEVLEKI